MAMKLILLQDVEDLGLAGEEVSVAPGYARNYLVPKGLATVASTAALRQLAARKEKIEEKRKADLAAAQAIVEKINTTELVIPMQASDDNHLFGSVNERIIHEALLAIGVKVDTYKIKLETQIRTLGDYTAEVKVFQQLYATAKIKVVRA